MSTVVRCGECGCALVQVENWLQGAIVCPDCRAKSRWRKVCDNRAPELGPYWISQEGHPPFMAFLSMREAGDHEDLQLRTTDGKLLRWRDPRYSWHDWQPSPPPAPDLEPEAGTWSHRPWREGLHRVVDRDGECFDAWVEACLDSHWSSWVMTWISRFGPSMKTCKSEHGAKWFRYPVPLPPEK